MILYKINKYFPTGELPNYTKCLFLQCKPNGPKHPAVNICSGGCADCVFFKTVLKRSIMMCKYKGVYRLIFDENETK